MTARRVERAALATLALGALIAFLLVPTYPNYDAYYHLVWGRELLDGAKPSFEAYQAPTEHPLYLALAAVLGLFGEVGDRLLVLVVRGLARGAGMGGLPAGRDGLRPLAGRRGGGLHRVELRVPALHRARRTWTCRSSPWSSGPRCSRRARRGAASRSWRCSAIAGLLRPEAWVLAGAYWLWLRSTRSP